MTQKENTTLKAITDNLVEWQADDNNSRYFLALVAEDTPSTEGTGGIDTSLSLLVHGRPGKVRDALEQVMAKNKVFHDLIMSVAAQELLADIVDKAQRVAKPTPTKSDKLS